MNKKESEKLALLLQNNPYMYYMTNWGFVDQQSEKAAKNGKQIKKS